MPALSSPDEIPAWKTACLQGDLLKGNEPAGLQGTTVFTGPWEPSKEPMLTVFKPSDEVGGPV